MIRAAFIAAIAAFLPFSALAQVNWSGGVVYEYDGSGNVRKIGTDTYLYDTAQRLIRGSVAGSQQSYTYDSFGNRKACQPAAGGDCQYGFKVDSTTNRIEGRTYDKRGNMLQLPEGNTLEYDELGMVRQENGTGRTVYYIYTADDERIAVYEADTQLSTHRWEWTLRGLDRKPLREFTSEGSSGTASFKWSKDHVWRDGALLASRQADAGAAGGVSTYHYHVDHLGTPRQVTSSASVILGRHDYLPFGPELTSTTINEPKLQDLKFTGHERDQFRDRPPLDYMHARYYEPRLGRFLSPDPGKDWDPSQPQSWNLYSYVRNNPSNLTDLTGMAITITADPPDPSDPIQSFRTMLDFYRWYVTWTDGNRRRLARAQIRLTGGASETLLAVEHGYASYEDCVVEGPCDFENYLMGMGGVAKGGSLAGRVIFRNALRAYNSTLTNAGRALTKHPEVVGLTKQTLRTAFRTDAALNKAASEALKTILRNGTRTAHTLPRYGDVIQVQIPGGFGARWYADGRFIGFINP